MAVTTVPEHMEINYVDGCSVEVKRKICSNEILQTETTNYDKAVLIGLPKLLLQLVLLLLVGR